MGSGKVFCLGMKRQALPKEYTWEKLSVCANQRQKRLTSQNSLPSLKSVKMASTWQLHCLPEKTEFLLGRERPRRIPPASPFSSQGLVHSHGECQAFALASTVTGWKACPDALILSADHSVNCEGDLGTADSWPWGLGGRLLIIFYK